MTSPVRPESSRTPAQQTGIYFYVYAQRNLGAAKTSAYYAIAPFIGVLLSFVSFREIPGVLFFIALAIMIAGTWMVNKDQIIEHG